jgi:hypothetical protein
MRVVTISDCDSELADSGDPLVVAQANPAVVRAVMRLLAESLEPSPPGPRERHRVLPLRTTPSGDPPP